MLPRLRRGQYLAAEALYRGRMTRKDVGERMLPRRVDPGQQTRLAFGDIPHNGLNIAVASFGNTTAVKETLKGVAEFFEVSLQTGFNTQETSG